MWIVLGRDGFVVAQSYDSELEGGIKVQNVEIKEELNAYELIAGELVLNEERLKNLREERKSEIQTASFQDERIDFNLLDMIKNQALEIEKQAQEILGLEKRIKKLEGAE